MASRDADGEYCLAQLATHAPLLPLLENPSHRALIRGSAGNAPFLARLMTKYPDQLTDILSLGATQAWQQLAPQTLAPATNQHAGIMQHLRHVKARAALTIALADINGDWPLEQVTHAISTFATDAVTLALRFLLRQAAAKGEVSITSDEAPETGTGIIILGMGKLGAFELNYSSDIDVIVLFDHDTLPYKGARNANIFMNKLAGDLVTLLQERTSDGYVFRTDLRLRPDPMSTPLAVTTSAALTYYETVGQNWERAAMIKARPIAGDMVAAERYMRELVPFIWRKTLDFATIADIHSIKRQMNVKAAKEISLPGHNIKTGIGGIREIEFFVQTQQLVWGGRMPALRLKGTIETLHMMTECELVQPEVRDTLSEAYRRLRHLEHRLQMRNDEQTHSLPTDTVGMREVSMFCGYERIEDFSDHCLGTLAQVSAIYTESMGDSEPLAVDGNLVFTGVEADPDTLSTLANMGYGETQRISDIIQGWHRGHRKSTRSKRSLANVPFTST
jgi:glutamate-ammonia-ligase adenylyltransferase